MSGYSKLSDRTKELPLSTRIINAMIFEGFVDFWDFCENCSESKMHRIPNLGRGTMNAIKDIARQYQIPMKQTIASTTKIVSMPDGTPLPLSHFGPSAIKALTGHVTAEALPSAKNATPPYVWGKGMPIPVANGVPISVWHKNPNSGARSYQEWVGNWSARDDHRDLWETNEFVVYRIRNSIVVPTQDSLLIRIAETLDRIAALMETAR